MRKWQRGLIYVDAISNWSGKFVAFLIVFLIGALIWEVVLRYAFDSPTIWVHESCQLIFAIYGILGGAYALLHKAHVTCDLLYVRFSVRVRAILDLITSPMFFIFCGVLLLDSLGFGLTSLKQLQHSTTPFSPPLYPFKLMLPLAALLIILQGLAKFTRDFYVAITGRLLT